MVSKLNGVYTKMVIITAAKLSAVREKFNNKHKKFTRVTCEYKGI